MLKMRKIRIYMHFREIPILKQLILFKHAIRLQRSSVLTFLNFSHESRFKPVCQPVRLEPSKQGSNCNK